MAKLDKPSICAIMLTRDRPEMARQAVECFRRQTYPVKRLFILDTGIVPLEVDQAEGVYAEHYPIDAGYEAKTIGQFRNWANGYADDQCLAGDIICHFDDDDFSHPNRIAEQVALLQSSGADCVGYNEMLFWRQGMESCLMQPRLLPDGNGYTCEGCGLRPGEAWLYSNPNPSYVLGTSMCYWRKAWEARPFEATSQGEDVRWCAGVRCVGVSAMPRENLTRFIDDANAPRMIARIHAGNTSNAYRLETMARASEWRRVPEWDQYCRSVFA